MPYLEVWRSISKFTNTTSSIVLRRTKTMSLQVEFSHQPFHPFHQPEERICLWEKVSTATVLISAVPFISSAIVYLHLTIWTDTIADAKFPTSGSPDIPPSPTIENPGQVSRRRLYHSSWPLISYRSTLNPILMPVRTCTIHLPDPHSSLNIDSPPRYHSRHRRTLEQLPNQPQSRKSFSHARSFF